MTRSSFLSSAWKFFGLLFFLAHLLMLAVLLILILSSTGSGMDPGWILLCFPVPGMLSGWWIFRGKYGWVRAMVMALGFVIFAGLLIMVLVVGPAIEKIHQQKAAPVTSASDAGSPQP